MRVSCRGGWVVGCLLVLAGALGAAGAPELDEELRLTRARARTLLEAGRGVQALEGLERLTRSRPRDPRVWWLLGNLRLRLASAEPPVSSWRGASRALARAAALGPESMRALVTRRLAEAQLPPLPAREELDDLEVLRRRGAEGACWARLEDPGAPFAPARACPVSGVAWPRGTRRCPTHPDPRPLEPARVVLTDELFHAAMGSPEAWLRAQAVRLAPVRALERDRLRPLLVETDPWVLKTLLERLEARVETLADDPVARGLLRHLAGSPSYELRREAWKLLHALGELPEVLPADFARLLDEAERGEVSERLIGDLFRAAPTRYRPSLLGVLYEPEPRGVRVALELLVLDGTRSDRLAVARAMEAPGSVLLAEELPSARRAFLRLGLRQGRKLGTSPGEWVHFLELQERPSRRVGPPGR